VQETPTTTPTTDARPRAKWIVAVVSIVAGIGGLAAWAIASPGAVSYYKTPTEVRAMTNTSDRVLRVGGRVADGSLERIGARGVRFVITDGTQSVPVTYDGDVPDTLKDGTDAVAEGRLSNGTLEATRVLAKCSSKYVPKDRPEDLGRRG
jgi:cytochrome c-type biogenesis protein CcmE